MEGSLMLSAMAGFVIAFETNSLLLGFLAGAVVGMLVALLIAFSSIRLKLNQVAVGFVLFQLCVDLSTNAHHFSFVGACKFVKFNNHRFRKALENPRKPWNLKIKIQALENPGISTFALQKSWKIGDIRFFANKNIYHLQALNVVL